MSAHARITALLLVCALALAAVGCGRLGTLKGAAAPDAVAGESPTVGPRTPAAPPPRWAPTNELITGEAAEPPPISAGPRFDVGDPAVLAAQVKALCDGRATDHDEAAFLAGLAADMLADGVDAGRVTDAMIRARCAGLGVIVRAVVASGGAPVVALVVDRALFYGGAGAEPIISAAVSAGLQRDLGGVAPPAARRGGLRYAMAYFPATGSAPVVAEADELATLYDAARPGYGLYTFILAGAPDDAAGLDTYRELLRVIETYVLVASTAPALPIAETHVFLVPLLPERSGAELLAQTDPALSASMREAFANTLRGQGRADLAARVAGGRGPFLVTTLAPTLVAGGRATPRLLVDLSTIGPEYAYAVIDAFDRPIPPELTGDAASLLPIQARLLAIGAAPAGTDGDATLASGGFIHLLGTPGQAAAAPGPQAARATVPAADALPTAAPAQPQP